MNAHEQRIEIGKVCGWVCEPDGWWHKDGVSIHGYMPDYTSDLNAMCEAEKTLLHQSNLGHQYILHLWEVTGLQKLRGFLLLSRDNSHREFNLQVDKIWELWVVATPAHRAEAFLRVMGKWQDHPATSTT